MFKGESVLGPNGGLGAGGKQCRSEEVGFMAVDADSLGSHPAGAERESWIGVK